MFHALHRLMVVFLWCVAVLVAVFLYQHRDAFTPAVDLVRAAHVRIEHPPAEIPPLQGTVTRVFDGYSFQVRTADRRLYNFRLAGLDQPPMNIVPTEAELEFGREGKEALSNQILSREVRVHPVSLTEQNTGSGVVILGAKNVNVEMAQKGFGRVTPEQRRGLDLGTQYLLLRAERLARKNRAGVWDEPASDAAGADAARGKETTVAGFQDA